MQTRSSVAVAESSQFVKVAQIDLGQRYRNAYCLMNIYSQKLETGHKLIKAEVEDGIALLPDNYFQLIITSPPYNLGKEYEVSQFGSLEKYIEKIDRVISALVPKLANGGSFCWQVGNCVEKGEIIPLDILTYPIFKRMGLKLRNRIIWRFNFGLHATKRLSGRYETLLWFTKGDDYIFNLDAVRVPQLYPGKRHASKKGLLAGLPSGNPNGKNPSDFWEFSTAKAFTTMPIWEFPNVKANHPEKTYHPCQFPIELVERCVLAFTNENDFVLDPFLGTGTSIIGSLMHRRNAIGIDKSQRYLRLAESRIKALESGNLMYRPLGKPIYRPRPSERVTQVPVEWGNAAGGSDHGGKKGNKKIKTKEKKEKEVRADGRAKKTKLGKKTRATPSKRNSKNFQRRGSNKISKSSR